MIRYSWLSQWESRLERVNDSWEILELITSILSCEKLVYFGDALQIKWNLDCCHWFILQKNKKIAYIMLAKCKWSEKRKQYILRPTRVSEYVQWVEKMNLNLNSIGHCKLVPNTAHTEVNAKSMETYIDSRHVLTMYAPMHMYYFLRWCIATKK